MFGINANTGALRAAAVSLALTLASTAHAANGVLLTPAMCSDSNGFRDAYWAENNTVSTTYPNIFFMREGGSIVKVKGTDDLADITDLMITAHGSCTSISNWTNYEFVQLLKANLPDFTKIKKIKTVSCHGADMIGPTPDHSSLLRYLNQEFTSTRLFTGFKGVASISGAGSTILGSKFTGNSYVSDMTDLGKLQVAKAASDGLWASHPLTIAPITQDLQVFCKLVTQNASFMSDGLLSSIVKDMYDETVAQFTAMNTPYWSEITKLLKHGSKPVACGPDYNNNPGNYSKTALLCKDL